MHQRNEKLEAPSALLQALKQRVSGRLSVGERATEISIYLLNGEILAAVAPDDEVLLLRRLARTEAVPTDVSDALQRLYDSGNSIYTSLFDLVDEAILDRILFERFRDTLARFLGSPSPAHLYSTKTAFVENVQLGHDGPKLIQHATDIWKMACRIDLDESLEIGDTQRAPPALRSLLGALPHHGTTRDFVDAMDMEPLFGRATLSHLVDLGALKHGEHKHAPPPASPWEHPELEDAEVLEAFADHDHVRGDGGAFSSDQKTLDRVEVELPVDDDTTDSSPAPPSGSPRFGARVLTEEEAFQKLNVAGNILKQMIEAFDRSIDEQGHGLQIAQLLLDGSPPRYAALFEAARLSPDGELPYDVLVQNVLRRPASERRQLVNKGLVDLIERALSLSMDELTDDTAIDHLLEQTAGYRQRIGL